MELSEQVKELLELVKDSIINAALSSKYFEIPKYYQNESRFDGVCSSNNLIKIKVGHT